LAVAPQFVTVWKAPGSGDERGTTAAEESRFGYPASMDAGRGVTGGAALMVRAETACSAVAGPVFVSAFTLIGARRAGYDWRRHAVSSLADGREGCAQRAT
jgi:hypothetical protein